MSTKQVDIINQLAGLSEGSPVAALREARPETLAYAHGSFRALLEPDDVGGVSRLEREAIGLRVATREHFPTVAGFHRARLRDLAMSDAKIAAIESGSTDGLSPRLAAILTHTDLLTTASRCGSQEAIAALKAVGLTARDIVTISQLIAYLSYQIRMIATIRALGGAA